MHIIDQEATLLAVTKLASSPVGGSSEAAELIERAGRVCWKSEDKISPGTARAFCEKLLRVLGHESVTEHASATILLVTDRITANQVVRHRIAAYSQESTHFLNYAGKKFDRQVQVCKPWILRGVSSGAAYDRWRESQEAAEEAYFDLIENHGWPHWEARFVLPLGLKTELVATYNFRQWRHVLRCRMSAKNTPEIQSLMRIARAELERACPEIFSLPLEGPSCA
jgi:thymidylate synthase (FAD)